MYMRLFFELAILIIQLVLLWYVAVFLWRMLRVARTRPIHSPFIPTSTRHADTIATLLSIRPGDTVYELGSGDGRVLIALARSHPESTCIGIERSLVLVILSRIRAFFSGARNVTFERANLYERDLSNANAIYAYLLPHAMKALYPKLETELRAGSRLVARAFPLHEKKAVRMELLEGSREFSSLNRLYLYQW